MNSPTNKELEEQVEAEGLPAEPPTHLSKRWGQVTVGLMSTNPRIRAIAERLADDLREQERYYWKQQGGAS